MPTPKGSWIAAASIIAGVIAVRSLRQQRSLAGKVVLITGGSRGLGLQLAREFAREGCKLLLSARSGEELRLAQAELERISPSVHIFHADLTDADDLRRMVDAAVAVHGLIDIVVNNAGRIDVAPLEVLSEADFKKALDLMFWAPARIILQLLPKLLAHGDCDVVNISSVGGRISVPHLIPYSTAKFALTGLSEGISAELRHKGVHVLTVSPGLMRTGSHLQAEFKGQQDLEYRWFAVGATLPGIAMNVTRAAWQIVDGVKQRRRSLTLTWSAQVASRLHGAFPGATQVLMEGMNSMLPSAGVKGAASRGKDLHQVQPSWVRAITSLGDKAVESQHENIASPRL